MTDRIPTVEEIDALLPQTQCTKCGYQGCKPYAEAIAQGDAINKCPPGGQAGIRKLAQLLNRPDIPLDTSHGEERIVPLVAYIREPECIGCTKCMQACPVDAIIGAAKLMHTVVTDICTGCDLCVAPCPVDCIDMVPAPQKIPGPGVDKAAVEQERADLARQHFYRRNQRLAQQAEAKLARRAQHRANTIANTDDASTNVDSTNVDSINDTNTDNNRTHRISASVAATLAAVRGHADAQSSESRQAQLERALASAQERFARADAKVHEAEKKSSSQLPMLQARREDMRFKLDEARQKLDALQREQQFSAAADKMTALRQRKSDTDRIANGISVIERKIAVLQAGLKHQAREQRVAMESELARLRQKLADAQQALDEHTRDEQSPNDDQSP